LHGQKNGSAAEAPAAALQCTLNLRRMRVG
jgi:hypothetical protein